MESQSQGSELLGAGIAAGSLPKNGRLDGCNCNWRPGPNRL